MSMMTPSPEAMIRPQVDPSRFLFIDSSASFTSEDVKQQQICQVRSHVMRESRRIQCEAKRKRRHENTSTGTSRSLNHCDKCGGPLTAFLVLGNVIKISTEREFSRETPACCVLPQFSSWDIFACNLEINGVSKFHQPSMSLQSKSVSRKPLWLIKAVVDPAMLSTTFIVASNQKSPVDIEAEKNQMLVSSRDDAISKIRTSIWTSNFILSGEMFTNVITLALHECLDGDLEQCHIHLRGLEEIIQHRGPNWTDDLDLISLQLLFWLDVCDPLDFHGRNRLDWPIELISSSLKSSLRLSTNIEIPGCRYMDRNSHPVALMQGFFGQEFVDIFADIMIFTKFIDFLQPNEEVKLNQAMFGERLLLIDLRLSASIKDLRHYDLVMHHTRKVVRFSCLLYVNVMLRDIPRSLKIIRRLASKLHHSLVSSGLLGTRFLSAPLLKVILWALFLGKDCTVDESESTWYLYTLAQFCVMFGFRWWKDVRNCLMETCWLGSDCDTRCKSHWADVLEIILNVGSKG